MSRAEQEEEVLTNRLRRGRWCLHTVCVTNLPLTATVMWTHRHMESNPCRRVTLQQREPCGHFHIHIYMYMSMCTAQEYRSIKIQTESVNSHLQRVRRTGGRERVSEGERPVHLFEWHCLNWSLTLFTTLTFMQMWKHLYVMDRIQLTQMTENNLENWIHHAVER